MKQFWSPLHLTHLTVYNHLVLRFVDPWQLLAAGSDTELEKTYIWKKKKINLQEFVVFSHKAYLTFSTTEQEISSLTPAAVFPLRLEMIKQIDFEKNYAATKMNEKGCYGESRQNNSVTTNFHTNTCLTLTLLTWRKGWAPNNTSRWQIGFNSAFKELNPKCNLPGFSTIKSFTPSARVTN